MTGQTSKLHTWWADLRHGGLLISPVVLNEWLPEGPPPLDDRRYRRLRDRFTAFLAKTTGDGHGGPALHDWIDALLEEFLRHPKERWRKGADIPEKVTGTTVTGQRLRPHRVLLDEAGTPTLLVAVDDSPRVGMHRGRRVHARFIELLRLTGRRLGLLTNGRQVRLCYAGLDHDAWCEWETETWFAQEETRRQLQGLVALLGPDAFQLVDGNPQLHAAVEASRSRQGELSQVLGDQVRQAVELLVSGLDAAARANSAFVEPLYQSPAGPRLPEKEALSAIYQAATRLVMRLVVALFAEARDLLPRSQPVYDEAYGIEGLFAQLESAARHEGLRGLEGQRGAWRRILALFRLIHGGSHHEALPVPAYGGTLFRAGDLSSSDPVLRALALFEDPRVEFSDRSVQELLRLLKVGRIRVRRGTASAWVAGPVDFSDLRTEYIGMMYEGLLDYELKRVPTDTPMLVLALGKEPVLPLNLIEGLSDRDLKDLINKLAKEKDRGPVQAEGEDEDAEEVVEEEQFEESEAVAEEETLEATDVEEEETEEAAELPDEETALHDRAMTWAVRAVEVGGLVRRPRGKRADEEAFSRQKVARARSLLRQVLAPGEMYIARWGGTRKGAGTFYTRPQLAVPTVHRTLEPLVYEIVDGVRKPRPPEAILALKVCDPAMGSASFLIAALRYLAEALYESLVAHGRIASRKDEGLVTLPFGQRPAGGLTEELIPVPPDDERFENMLKAKLKRYVVERCLYGVDINPLAVELARLSLWVETMDRELPFEFLDHRLKVGNSLVGCWFDRFEDYPALAWAREGGDGSKGQITKRIKDILNGLVKQELRAMLERRGPQLPLTFGEEKHTADEVQVGNLEAFRRLEAVPLNDPDGERERIFREEIQGSPELAALHHAFDRWCAVWFWPVADGPGALPLPSNFSTPDTGIDEIVSRLVERHRFFHWELEFPDVFVRENPGFDAVLGNPPWDTQKPNSKEFFSNYDPIYRTYGKQEALGHQRRLFEQDPAIEAEWLRYVGDFKAMGNWVRSAADPFEISLAKGKANQTLKRAWQHIRGGRTGYADGDHPYRHQGSADINTYKLFLETAHHLLPSSGRLGFIVPSGIYTDKGTTDLRKLFLDQCRWDWLFGFENRRKVFPIDSRFKFCAIIVQKGGTTTAIQAAFMHRNLGDWEEGERHAIAYTRAQVDRFSPNTRAILEICDRRDLEMLEKIYSNSVLLGDDSEDAWKVQYAREFDMTTDSKIFPPRPAWEGKGYRSDEYGRWVGPDESIAIPLYQGRLIGQFDFSRKGWVSGKGRGSVWRSIPWENKTVEPEFLADVASLRNSESYIPGLKICHMRMSSATNERSMIASLIRVFPAESNVIAMQSQRQQDLFLLVSILNSFAFDSLLRMRFVGLALDYHVTQQVAIPKTTRFSGTRGLFEATILRLNCCHPLFAPEWLHYWSKGSPKASWRRSWAVTHHERLRLRCVLDAVVAELYGLDWQDLAWILRDCDHPTEQLSALLRNLDRKGFWRIDKDKDPELRHPVLTLAAFHDLKETIAQHGGDLGRGIEAFYTMNDGDGWQIPETLCLADIGLGHDDRAKQPQPVRSHLGDRFLPWQFEKSVEESWADCERHARSILGEEGFVRFQAQLQVQEESRSAWGDTQTEEQRGVPTSGSPGTQRRLFAGESTLFGDSMEDPPPRRKKR